MLLLVFHFAFGLACLGPATLAAGNSAPLRLVAYGDSLMAGYQIAASAAFPARLEQALKAKGHAVEVANAGVSGDTTAAGLARLDWAIPDGTDAVILEFGANDMLRGLDPAAARRNLERMIERIEARGAVVLLTGMRSVRNWGDDYATRFEAMFPDLARAHGLALYPFFLDGVVDRPDLKLADGLHPNASGVDRIVAGILPLVERMVLDRQAASAKPRAPG